jgi:DNA polymerase-3 subunit delta'
MPFRNIVGHHALVDLLARAVARETLPPSLIFAGPSGVGKFTTAVALAEVMNCTAPLRGLGERSDGSAGPRVPVIDACGTCASCRRIARVVESLAQGSDAAADCLRTLVPDDKGSIKIGPVRTVIAASAYRPFDGRRRLVVIDEADLLEVDAQNALLKVLEEPPPGTVFALLTSRPDALLPTIRSRCPRLRFGPLPAATIAAHLVAARGVASAEAHAAASQSGGSLGQALDRLGGGASEARRVAAEILGMVARSEAPATRLAAAQVLLAKAARTEGKKATGSVTRAQIAERLEAMAALLRDVAVVASGAGSGPLANADLHEDLARLAPRFDRGRAVRAFAAVDRALFGLERNVGHKVVADWIALAL